MVFCCARCGGSATDAEPFACTDCGRLLGICSNPDCGWCVRLFDADDPADCDGCGWQEKDPNEDARLFAENGPCPDCGGPRTSPDKRCFGCRINRLGTAIKQMRERSGPVYEQSKERSKVISAAWRAAGSPPKVSLVYTSAGPRYYLAAPLKKFEDREATPEQVEAWYAWHRERSRLFRENGWGDRR